MGGGGRRLVSGVGQGRVRVVCACGLGGQDGGCWVQTLESRLENQVLFIRVSAKHWHLPYACDAKQANVCVLTYNDVDTGVEDPRHNVSMCGRAGSASFLANKHTNVLRACALVLPQAAWASGQHAARPP